MNIYYPRSMELLVNMWKNNEISREELQRFWEDRWRDRNDYITYWSRNVSTIIDLMIEKKTDVEIYFNLKTMEFVGPFEYRNNKLRNDKDHICVFDKK
jgi:hypothetical protein